MILFWIVFWKRNAKQIKISQARKAQTLFKPLHQTEQILVFPEQICFVLLRYTRFAFPGKYVAHLFKTLKLEKKCYLRHYHTPPVFPASVLPMTEAKADLLWGFWRVSEMLLFLFLSLITINWDKILAPVASSVLLSNIVPRTIFWLSGQMTQLRSKLQGTWPCVFTGSHRAVKQIVVLFVFLFSLKYFK